MPLVASLSGIRGTVPDSLNSDSIGRFVRAFAQYVGKGVVVVGRDGRPSGKSISDEVVSLLNECGLDVNEIGIVPTPTVQMEILRHHAAGGISISASHNPSEWNGLKFLGRSSMFLSPAEATALIARANSPQPSHGAAPALRGTTRTITDAIDAHIETVLASTFIDVPSIRSRKYRIVVDAVNAGGSVAIPRLLEALGCEVIRLYCDGSGIFPHTPEPVPLHLGALCESVRSEKADLGVAVDPDSDRLVLITEAGIPFGEEYTLVECVETVLRKKPGTPVVTNLSTTRAVEVIARVYGSKTVRTPVGEINVALAMQEHGAIIGGEGSGGVILSPIHLGRDALVGCALTLQNLTETTRTASELRAALPSYEIVKHKIACNSLVEGNAVLSRISTHWASEELRTDDGVHVTFSNGDWLHARTSNTEPIVRFIAEAATAAAAQHMVDEAVSASA